jgi:outer membrane protein OmpA-like peptidoglycan-associated protein
MARRLTLAIGGIGLLALTGCLNPDGATPNTQAGATTGAILGGFAGLVSGGDNRLGRAAVGAGIGAAVGGLIGANLDRQARELQRDMGAGVAVTNTGSEILVSMPDNILFALDSAAVEPRSRAQLRVLAESLNRYPETRIEVAGHTDSTGSAAYNQGLSERRAAAVAAVLRGEGVRGDRIISYGLGETQPVATNLTAEGRAQNRRVDIIIRPTG